MRLRTLLRRLFSSNNRRPVAFRFREIPGSGQLYIHIEEGKYKDVDFFYPRVKFADEPNQDGTLHYHFDCSIINAPKELEGVDLENDQEFKELASKLLIYVIE